MEIKSAPSPTEQLEALLAVCKAGGDQMRVKVLHLLNQESYGVLELCRLFNCKQPTMSHHLKTLTKAGLVTSRREGSTIFYRRIHRPASDHLAELQDSLLKAIDALSTPKEIQEKIELVKQDRASNSRRFFTENFQQVNQQQAQVAAYEIYAKSTIELIKKYGKGKTRSTNVLEIGPGDGSFLTTLSPLFDQVYALDNSKEMLELATAHTAETGLTNVHFIDGDTKSKQLKALTIEYVVINMVLHHVPSPANIFVDIANKLDAGGQLFISELCSHNQEWVRKSCGDLWLGFEPEEITEWAESAGFNCGESIYLSQRNGFRIQIRHFIKTA
ncbi:metalloregulator ArsR/SmtB family transcription factor [Oceanicoccus sp. KOV_DT_Chl]|uniref:ArsR/SmtB family transcription factor n=1 Tax=Oceanicoccus sp. KOV_DT_Chl TaxID=1904639 RepID=UPI000C7C585A|nr:metalloregulator ArsR/SmtB family transcription factor [Oceanicoccus sp. KOV_DT_Chl]